jgi:esterase/lipase
MPTDFAKGSSFLGQLSRQFIRFSKPALMITQVHGIGNYSSDFSFLGPALARSGWTVLAPDLLG